MLGVGALGPRPLPGSAVQPVESESRRSPAVTIDVTEREALALLVSAEGLGPITLGRLIDSVGSARAVVELALRAHGLDALVAASRVEPGAAGQRPMALGVATEIVAVARSAEERLRTIERAGVAVVTLADAAYPARLRAIELPPHVLFVRGESASLDRDHAIAVVGTRRPTELGRRIAARLGAALSAVDATVISGLAVGIDGAAHASVTANAGTTVAVLGGGHDRLFPRAHRRLADAIVDGGGAVVSEFAPSVRPTRGTFPRRNRVISGLGDATIVVEARIGSGALITASWALQQGRGCYLVPGALDAPTSQGCLAFLREAEGEARIVAGIPELIEDLELARPVAGPSRAVPGGRDTDPLAPLVGLGATAECVGTALVEGLGTADELVAATGLPVATILSTLTVLEGRGLVVGAYGRYQPAGRLAGAQPARTAVR